MDEGVRILGVDDSLTIRKALELVLRPAGYQLELAASGAEAVEKAKGFRPAIMLLDFILPDMRGTEVCKRLAADPETADIPVVLISAKGAEIRQAYQDVGNVVNYITKPFTPEDVTGVVSEVLTKAREGGLIKVQPPVPAPPAPAVEVRPVRVEVPVPPPAPAARPPRPWTPPPVVEVTPRAAAEVWEEGEEAAEEEAAAVRRAAVGMRREAIEVMFETLRAGLEGVYVEEVDTSAGAAADEAKSYMDLVSQLTRQLGETLSQARSGLRYALGSDGSVRSLGDAFFDAYRRLCRLLFRAVAAGAIEPETSGGRARVLVVCRRDGDLFDSLQSVTGRQADWHTLFVTERFRQLPLVTRLYGPTHVVVESIRGGALGDQLKVIAAMPEARRLQFLGVVRAGAAEDRAALKELGVETIIADGPEFVAALRQAIGGPAKSAADRSEDRAAANQ